VGVDDGAAVADPFLPAADVVWLLQIRAEQERAARAPSVPVGRFAIGRQRAAATA
jgi:hypothetical protein